MFIAYFFLLVTVPLSYYLGFVEGIKFFGGLNIVGQILYTSIILTFGIFVFAGAYRWRYTESTITGKLLSGLFSKLGVPNGLEKFVRLLYGR
ncbi:hypothetical protein [Pseudoalteromonas phage J2-1_QLiu-2017]|nr:hypothetical protein [Pseudoalteromonas phage J2-1_QLiu-2017]